MLLTQLEYILMCVCVCVCGIGGLKLCLDFSNDSPRCRQRRWYSSFMHIHNFHGVHSISFLESMNQQRIHRINENYPNFFLFCLGLATYRVYIAHIICAYYMHASLDSFNEQNIKSFTLNSSVFCKPRVSYMHNI